MHLLCITYIANTVTYTYLTNTVTYTYLTNTITYTYLTCIYMYVVGAIFGACAKLEQYAITKDEYQARNQSLPDWSTFDPSANTEQYDSAV